MAASTLAIATGVAIKPGVSRNRRLYTRELIARMVARAQERLSDPDGMPLTMLTHHDAEDDSTEIVGRLVELSMDKTGAVHFVAEMATTGTARDILNLIEPDAEGRQFLRGVSIRGFWLGPVRTESGPDGGPVEVGDDLELDGLDFTKSPGVPGARVDAVQRTEPAEAGATESAGRTVIHESVQEALVDTTPIKEESPVTPASEPAAAEQPRVTYADNGYTGRGQRYPLGTAAETVNAWYAFTQESVTAEYTPPQLKRARQRIARALETHGLTATAGVLAGPVRAVNESSVLEMFDDDSGAFKVELTNGPICVCVSSWYLEADQLPAIGKAAMDGAISALLAIDPDLNGGGGGGEPTEAATEDPAVIEAEQTTPDPEPAAPAADIHDETVTAPVAVADTPGEEPAMTEPTTPAADTQAAAAPSITLTGDQFDALLARIGGAKPAEAAAAPATEAAPEAPAAATETAPPAAPATPAAPVAAQETDEQRIARLVQDGITAALQGHAAAGGLPTRKGLVPGATESAAAAGAANFVGADYGLPAEWPQKPLHTYTEEERAKYLRPSTEQTIMGARSIYRQPQ
ncbi:hypothetical protein [Amycolatopsis sp. WAC 04197]|uniref:hypothetical protein n=1 Tax=Amycolatopsis sp. WAC 04197 TaxID=2203199 RepID=UPI000F7A6D91|nr:hypothetical protein [Amycolatopsis sp. WAC 04197]